jgi:hypothetical protein
MSAIHRPDRPRVVHKLLREVARAEDRVCEHADRETARYPDTAPARALAAIAEHAVAERERLTMLADGYGATVPKQRARTSAGMLRRFLDTPTDALRAYEIALDEIDAGIEIVKALRYIARDEGLFGLIRWCDDWLSARRTLLPGVAAQIAWYAERCVTADDERSRDW